MKLHSKACVESQKADLSRKPKLPAPLVSKLLVGSIAAAGFVLSCRAIFTDTNLIPVSLTPVQSVSASASPVDAGVDVFVAPPPPPEPCFAVIKTGRAKTAITMPKDGGASYVTLDRNVKNKNKHVVISLTDQFWQGLSALGDEDQQKEFDRLYTVAIEAVSAIKDKTSAEFDCMAQPGSIASASSSSAPVPQSTVTSSPRPTSTATSVSPAKTSIEPGI